SLKAVRAARGGPLRLVPGGGGGSGGVAGRRAGLRLSGTVNRASLAMDKATSDRCPVGGRGVVPVRRGDRGCAADRRTAEGDQRPPAGRSRRPRCTTPEGQSRGG